MYFLWGRRPDRYLHEAQNDLDGDEHNDRPLQGNAFPVLMQLEYVLEVVLDEIQLHVERLEPRLDLELGPQVVPQLPWRTSETRSA